LAGTGIATVFVDYQLRILRFTPSATRIINLILSDVGRPVSHIVSNLVGYDRLAADTQAVLDTLVSKEVDVQTTEDKWYTLRIQPYRTLSNVIEGAVITFVDITEISQTGKHFGKPMICSVWPWSYATRTMPSPCRTWMAASGLESGAVRMYGWSEAEAMKMNIRELIPKGLREEALAKAHQLSRAQILEPYRTQRIAKDGAVVEISMVSTSFGE